MENKIKDKRMPPDLIPTGTIRDFLLPIVEFLGILVPGIIFILASFPSFAIPSIAIINIIETNKVIVPIVSEDLVKSILEPNSIKIFILLILSYVIGHIFFRQDPKIPDTKSFERVPDDIRKDGPVRLCEDEIKYNIKKYGDDGEKKKHNMEFPYRYLHEYLTDRGMPHLAEKITWKGNDPKTYKNRTKHFINILKVHLEFLFPYQYTRIQRNEAHVRLMSSMWYCSKSIISLSTFGSFLGIISVIFVYKITNSLYPMPYFSAIFWPIFSLFSAFIIKSKIEGFLHYQRIREIVFIMEAAHFADQLYPEFKIGGSAFWNKKDNSTNDDIKIN